MPQASCFCGANVVSWDVEPVFSFRCHCTDERKLTGAAFALNSVYPVTEPTVLKGELSVFGKIVASGNMMYNHVCGQCGTLIYRHSTGYPGVITVKAGTIDAEEDPAETFVAQIEIFTRSRVSNIPALEGVPQEAGDFTKESLVALGF